MSNDDIDLRTWLTAIQCEDLLPALGKLGVGAPADIQWLSDDSDETHMATLMAELNPVQRAKFKAAIAGLGPGGTIAPAPAAEEAITVPDWTSSQGGGDALGAFAELQQGGKLPLLAQTVALGGKEVPLVAVAGGGLGLVVLVLLLVVAVAPNSCDGVECGKFGACQNGDCACQAGYSSVAKQSCAVDKCYRVDCGAHGTCNPVEHKKNHKTVSTWTCDCKDHYFGDRCENDPCQNVQCGTHGNCHGNGICECSQGWAGARCSIDLCDGVHCGAHGHCNTGACGCDSGWGGKSVRR